jgi:enoyl-CoA hydratase/carnithine racemase
MPVERDHIIRENAMSYETILFEKKEGIGYLRLNRPEVYNAINDTMIRELHEILLKINEDGAVRVLIITGEGKAFQAGADIAQINKMSAIEMFRWNEGIVRFCANVEYIRQPVIAAVNGYALGGGLELALSCTLRIAAESAKLGLPEVTLGIIPGAGGTQRLPRLIGKGMASELILTGEMVTAQRALELGMVNRVVPDNELMAESEKMAQKILKNAPIAVEMSKNAIEVGFDLPLEAANQYAQKNLISCFSTEDMREGTRAFLEKRKPDFKGK